MSTRSSRWRILRPEPDGIAPLLPQPPPGAGTPNDNPYMPIGDTGASQFMAAHPTWDGRGVTIGILERGITLDHPSLLTTSTGERKIVDWVTATDPFVDNDPTWLNMQDQVSGSDLHLHGVLYTAPAKAATGSGCSTRAIRLGGEVGSDVNRDGNPAERHLRGAVEPQHQHGLGRYEPEQQLRRRHGDDRLQGQLRRQLVRHRQPGDRESPSACRSSCRPTASTRSSTSASSPARTARTSPASRPGTACSAAR